jgi:chromosome segregation ATPase
VKQEYLILRESEPIEVDSPALKEDIRILQRKNDEIELRAKQLVSELNEVREEKNRVVADKEQNSISHSQQFGQSLTRTKTLESELERLHRRCERLQEENDQQTRNNNKMHDQVLRLEKERLILQNQLDEKSQTFQSERLTLKSNFEQREREAERHRGNLINQINELNKRLESVQASKQDLLHQLTHIQTEANEKMRASIEREGEKQNQLELEKQHLQSQIQELESTVHLVKQQTRSEVQRISKELETLRAATQKAYDDRDALNKRLENDNLITAQLRRELDDTKAYLDKTSSEASVTKQERDQIESKLLEEQNIVERLKLNLEYQEKQIHELNDALERERTSRQETMDQSTQKVFQERKKLQERAASLTDELDKIKSKYERLKTMHKETVDKYKDKVKSYHKKIDVMTNKISQVETESKATQERLWEEKKHYVRRISELEREKDKLIFLSQPAAAVGVESDTKLYSEADESQSAASSTNNFEKLYSTTLKNFKELQAMSQRVDTWNK